LLTTLVLLAGGESRRFGRDKSLVLVDGKPSISRIVDEFTRIGIVNIVVVSKNYEKCKLYKSILPEIECAIDKPLECGGPLRGIYSVGDRGSKYYYLVPVDTPWIEPRAYVVLSSYLDVYSADIASPLYGDKYVDPLISVISSTYFSQLHSRVERICSLRGSLRATDLLRIASTVVLVGSRHLTRLSYTLSHINTENDLKIRPPRGILVDDVVVIKQPSLGLASSHDELRGISTQQYNVYKNLGIEHLATHAERDSM